MDFRKGAHGLAAEVLGQDPFSGVVLVFRSRRADRIKMLVWDTSGLVLVWKQLGLVEGWPNSRIDDLMPWHWVDVKAT
ncbi:IS66 family insertion sequence element accessory protein TnpB [Roseomonas sp. SSH11]|uniref:IS66 family insertion sequence element accessory protein TnpB n=1 Tax=Pararoseomonas baculiformis TaxID=2820812 RepID=A0ABS4AL38_9PROT|nr:IS66 family insertion sequence element accessory protein TnpB [Pararoseomonas baculiformis]MBP0447738.1 IS66 family insertion sequence element accessory protein TnpB [Pararoseomonas baculiformis]